MPLAGLGDSVDPWERVSLQTESNVSDRHHNNIVVRQFCARSERVTVTSGLVGLTDVCSRRQTLPKLVRRPAGGVGSVFRDDRRSTGNGKTTKNNNHSITS